MQRHKECLVAIDNLIMVSQKASHKCCVAEAFLCVPKRVSVFQVLDRGEVQQFDQPYNLLQDEDGLFYQMVQQTGQKYANELITIAQNKHNRAAVGEVVSEEKELVKDDSSKHNDNIIPEERKHESEGVTQITQGQGTANSGFLPTDDDLPGVFFPSTQVSSLMAENALIDASCVNVAFESDKSEV